MAGGATLRLQQLDEWVDRATCICVVAVIASLLRQLGMPFSNAAYFDELNVQPGWCQRDSHYTLYRLPPS